MRKEYDPENRQRFSEEYAREMLTILESDTPIHLIDNQDGTFSILVHGTATVNCNYCRTQGDARNRPDVVAVRHEGMPGSRS